MGGIEATLNLAMKQVIFILFFNDYVSHDKLVNISPITTLCFTLCKNLFALTFALCLSLSLSLVRMLT